MKSMLCLLACVAYVSATGLLHGGFHDDGQWRPWLDGSVLGASPGLATAVLGAASVGHGFHGAGHFLGKRSLGFHGYGGHGVVNPNALNVPLDTVHVAAAKNAQLVQQAAEGARNIHGGGVPAALPADTHAVAVGKVAHAVAHGTERAAHFALQGAHGLGAYGLGAGLHGGLGAAAAVAPVAALTAAAAPVAAVGGWGAGGLLGAGGAWAGHAAGLGGYGAGWGGHGAGWGGHGAGWGGHGAGWGGHGAGWGGHGAGWGGHGGW